MKKTFILLAWLIALQISEAAPSIHYFPNDMAVLVFHRGHTNLVKRTSVVHDGVRYHLFSGFVGSGIVTYTAFIYRETPKASY